MTKIQLAYAYEDHEPDDIIDVDDATASRLIYEGRARTPDETPSKSTSKSTSKTESEG